jgi:hypothetical protein
MSLDESLAHFSEEYRKADLRRVRCAPHRVPRDLVDLCQYLWNRILELNAEKYPHLAPKSDPEAFKVEIIGYATMGFGVIDVANEETARALGMT